MNLKENWEKFNALMMARREMRRHIEELEEFKKQNKMIAKT